MSHTTQLSSRDSQALALAQDIVADIELSRLPIDKLVLKSQRLARLVDEEDQLLWLVKEDIGYNKDAISAKWIKMTRRDSTEPTYYGSASTLLGTIKALEDIQLMIASSVSSGPSMGIKSEPFMEHGKVTVEIRKLRIIESAIRTLLFSLAAKHLYRLSFIERQSSMFEQAQTEIDRLLKGLDEETLRKLDAAHERLQSGDPEAISHALTSCRRLMDQAAGALFPATDETRNVGGTEVQLGQPQVLNRLKAYIDDHTHSDSRRTRLKQTFTNLWARTSAGVHADVSAAEAEYIYLTVYIAVGELISMREAEATVEVTVG